MASKLEISPEGERRGSKVLQKTDIGPTLVNTSPVERKEGQKRTIIQLNQRKGERASQRAVQSEGETLRGDSHGKKNTAAEKAPCGMGTAGGRRQALRGSLLRPGGGSD